MVIFVSEFWGGGGDFTGVFVLWFCLGLVNVFFFIMVVVFFRFWIN